MPLRRRPRPHFYHFYSGFRFNKLICIFFKKISNHSASKKRKRVSFGEDQIFTINHSEDDLENTSNTIADSPSPKKMDEKEGLTLRNSKYAISNDEEEELEAGPPVERKVIIHVPIFTLLFPLPPLTPLSCSNYLILLSLAPFFLPSLPLSFPFSLRLSSLFLFVCLSPFIILFFALLHLLPPSLPSPPLPLLPLPLFFFFLAFVPSLLFIFFWLIIKFLSSLLLTNEKIHPNPNNLLLQKQASDLLKV